MIKSEELKALDAKLGGALTDIVALHEFKGKKASQAAPLCNWSALHSCGAHWEEEQPGTGLVQGLFGRDKAAGTRTVVPEQCLPALSTHSNPQTVDLLLYRAAARWCGLAAPPSLWVWRGWAPRTRPRRCRTGASPSFRCAWLGGGLMCSLAKQSQY